MPAAPPLAKTPANFRAEIARHKIAQRDICRMIRMNPSFLSNLINETGTAVMYDWAANNIAMAINRLSGEMIFKTRTKLTRPTRGRPKRIDLFPLEPADPEAPRKRVPGDF